VRQKEREGKRREGGWYQVEIVEAGQEQMDR
jgi:hypothetical protein